MLQKRFTLHHNKTQSESGIAVKASNNSAASKVGDIELGKSSTETSFYVGDVSMIDDDAQLKPPYQSQSIARPIGKSIKKIGVKKKSNNKTSSVPTKQINFTKAVLHKSNSRDKGTMI